MADNTDGDDNDDVEQGWELLEPSKAAAGSTSEPPNINLRTSNSKVKYNTFIGGKWIQLEAEAADGDIQESDWEFVPALPPAAPVVRNIYIYMC